MTLIKAYLACGVLSALSLFNRWILFNLLRFGVFLRAFGFLSSLWRYNNSLLDHTVDFLAILGLVAKFFAFIALLAILRLVARLVAFLARFSAVFEEMAILITDGAFHLVVSCYFYVRIIF
jgi:hypothetical protein